MCFDFKSEDIGELDLADSYEAAINIVLDDNPISTDVKIMPRI
jgi:hypothetical protein